MPRKPSGNYDPKAYHNGYMRAKVRYKHVNFSVDKPEDMELLKWIEEQGEPVSVYLKRLAREDMQKRAKK